ncbi:MAG: TerC family protein [Alphaproteobacteria bacterium]|nr:TerC family protein [Alphaproteobacteria bacterium]
MLPEFLFSPFLGQPAWAWLGFIALVIVLLAFDLGVLHRKEREIEVRESLILSAFYIAMALAFGGFVWWRMGAEAGQLFITGFLVEKTLAMDNIFVISLIFTYFAVPRIFQHRVLLWGILGVIVLRGIMIGLGARLIEEFDWILLVFGAFLLFTGIKMLALADRTPEIGDNALLRFLRRRLRVTSDFVGNRFLVRRPHPAEPSRLVWYATPLFLALLMVEAADLVFAVDSIPAIFAITQDPYIVYTSNIFAILGLRALYFALAAMMHRFRYLKYALALILVFIGGKILFAELFFHVPAALSLGVTLFLLVSGIVGSLLRTRREEAARGLPAE